MPGKEIAVEFDEHGDILKQVQNSEPVAFSPLPMRTLNAPSRNTGVSGLLVILIGLVSVGIVIMVIGIFAVMQFRPTNTPVVSPPIVSESSPVPSIPATYPVEQPTRLPVIPLPSPTSVPTPFPTATKLAPSTIQTDTDEDLVEATIRNTTAIRRPRYVILMHKSFKLLARETVIQSTKIIDELTRSNLYEVQEQLTFEIVSISMGGNTATVITYETWRTVKYDRSTNECRYHQPTFHTQQTYTLIRERNQWKISHNDFDAPDDVPGC